MERQNWNLSGNSNQHKKYTEKYNDSIKKLKEIQKGKEDISSRNNASDLKNSN